MVGCGGLTCGDAIVGWVRKACEHSTMSCGKLKHLPDSVVHHLSGPNRHARTRTLNLNLKPEFNVRSMVNH